MSLCWIQHALCVPLAGRLGELQANGDYYIAVAEGTCALHKLQQPAHALRLEGAESVCMMGGGERQV